MKPKNVMLVMPIGWGRTGWASVIEEMQSRGLLVPTAPGAPAERMEVTITGAPNLRDLDGISRVIVLTKEMDHKFLVEATVRRIPAHRAPDNVVKAITNEGVTLARVRGAIQVWLSSFGITFGPESEVGAAPKAETKGPEEVAPKLPLPLAPPASKKHRDPGEPAPKEVQDLFQAWLAKQSPEVQKRSRTLRKATWDRWCLIMMNNASMSVTQAQEAFDRDGTQAPNYIQLRFLRSLFGVSVSGKPAPGREAHIEVDTRKYKAACLKFDLMPGGLRPERRVRQEEYPFPRKAEAPSEVVEPEVVEPEVVPNSFSALREAVNAVISNFKAQGFRGTVTLDLNTGRARGERVQVETVEL